MHVLVEPKALQGSAADRKLLLRLRLLVRAAPVLGREPLKAYPFSADCGPSTLESARRQLHTLRAKWSAKARVAEDLWEIREMLSDTVIQASYVGNGHGDSLEQFRSL